MPKPATAAVKISADAAAQALLLTGNAAATDPGVLSGCAAPPHYGGGAECASFITDRGAPDWRLDVSVESPSRTTVLNRAPDELP